MRKLSSWERVNKLLWCWIVGMGLVPRSWPGRPRIGSTTLRVRGRRSGVLRTIPVTWVEYDGERYLVAMMGEQSDWVHNARATHCVVTFRRGRSKRAFLEELPVEARAPILKAWLGRAGVSSVPRKYVGLKRYAPLHEFEKIAPRWPVFRIAPRTAIP